MFVCSTHVLRLGSALTFWNGQNLVDRWTWTSLMSESNLHIRVLQNKLTGELPKYLDIAKTELEYGWDLDIPQPDGK